jgi:hypothetical protein
VITTTVIRRVLAKLEAADLEAIHRTDGVSDTAAKAVNETARASCKANRVLQGDGVLLARMVRALNDETRGVGS